MNLDLTMKDPSGWSYVFFSTGHCNLCGDWHDVKEGPVVIFCEGDPHCSVVLCLTHLKEAVERLSQFIEKDDKDD